MKKWIRECQECGKEQETTPPPHEASERTMNHWLEKKCSRCKSEALDYGSWESDSE